MLIMILPKKIKQNMTILDYSIFDSEFQIRPIINLQFDEILLARLPKPEKS